VAGRRGQHAARETDAAVIGIEVECARTIAELTDFFRGELESQRPERVGLLVQLSGACVEDLVVAGGFLDEGRLGGVGLVEDHDRQVVREAQVAVKAAGQF
jgi:hypothetical protein